MGETPKENTKGFGCKTYHVEKNSDNGNDEQSDDVSEQSHHAKDVNYIAIWRSIFLLEAVGVADYSNILKLAELCLSFAIANAKNEAGFSHMKRLENNYRNQLGEEPSSSLMRMVVDGNPYPEHNSTKAV